MTEFIKILACGIVYFLVVYLFIIRREAQPIVPWALCIGVQVVSIVLFHQIVDAFKLIFPEEQYGSLGMILPSGLICVVNLGLIYLMFGVYLVNISKKDAEKSQKSSNIRIAPFPTFNGEEVKTAKNTTSDDNAITISFIEKMLAEGRTDEAVKYLRMLSYYSNDEQTRAEAKNLLSRLNEEKN